MFIDWLPDVLHDAGVAFRVEPGAERRSTTRSGLTVINGVVWHDTVTGTNWTDAQVRALLLNGNATTPGPLSQVGIARDGRWDIIAMGKCNHNGYGLWANDCIGLEFYNAGGDVGEVNPPVQVESGVIGTAAILTHLGRNMDAVKGHKETDPRRKRDPHALNMNNIRARIEHRILSPQEEEVNPEIEIDKAFHRWLGRPPKDDHEEQMHVWYAAVHGVLAAIRNIRNSQEARDYRK